MCSETILDKTSITISQWFHYKYKIVFFKALNNNMKKLIYFNLFLNFKRHVLDTIIPFLS